MWSISKQRRVMGRGQRVGKTFFILAYPIYMEPRFESAYLVSVGNEECGQSSASAPE